MIDRKDREKENEDWDVQINATAIQGMPPIIATIVKTKISKKPLYFEAKSRREFLEILADILSKEGKLQYFVE